MEQVIDKDIECVECGEHFKWKEVLDEDKPTENSCLCPHCKKEVWPVIPNGKIHVMFVVSSLYLSLAIFSVFNWTNITTALICGLGIVGTQIFIKTIFKNGKIATVRKNA